MTMRLGVVMDPIASIHYKKDSTLAMLWEAQARGMELFYFEQKDLTLQNDIPYALAYPLKVARDPNKWYELDAPIKLALADLNIILMRKDPPFDDEYIYTTYILEHAERLGVLVANRPQSLRDANEKVFATFFPQCITDTLVSQSATALHAFWQEHQDIICKPLNGMGGASIFRLRQDDVNANVIFATLTEQGKRYIMAQRYLPEIVQGDKRVLLIDGEPIPHVLARIPQGNDWRGNMAAGAKGTVQSLSEHDRWICAQVGPTLRERGLYFVGIDIIGDYLTEINVTSPTGIREIEAQTGMNVCKPLLDCLINKLSSN